MSSWDWNSLIYSLNDNHYSDGEINNPAECLSLVYIAILFKKILFICLGKKIPDQTQNAVFKECK